MTTVKNSLEYALVREFYGDRAAARSGVPLIKHIDEGLAGLLWLLAEREERLAWCIHPLVQHDDQLREHRKLLPCLKEISPHVIMLAMEYRWVANAALNRGRQLAWMDGEIHLSPLEGVNRMLSVDKIQNRKDFEKHLKGQGKLGALEERKLARYFENWLDALGVDEKTYQTLAAVMERA